jgi:hypothetical protein
MKNKIKVVVFDDTEMNGILPTTPEGFMGFWQEKIALIPDEFMETARIELETDYGYDGCRWLTCAISYIRLENDEEEAKRLKREDALRKDIEAKELRQLDTLKAKYEAKAI